MRLLLPPLNWLRTYQLPWLGADLTAGVTLAAYAVPVALAYATLAGLPPEVGVYGYILGGLGYALLGSSRHLAIGPTSAISLMVAASVGAMAGGDTARYAEIASLAAFAVAILCRPRLGAPPQRTGQADQRQHSGRFQSGRRHHHRDHPVAGAVRGRGRRPQRDRASGDARRCNYRDLAF